MKKRILVLLLALVMVAGFALPAVAAQDEIVSDEPVVIADDPTPTTDEETPVPTETPAPASDEDEGAADVSLAAVALSDGESETISYKNWNGTTLVDATIVKSNATKVTGETTTWGESDTTTWYYVDADTTINSAVTVSGNVNLILCDGKTLTVEVHGDGIKIGDGASLTIYAQSTGTSAGTLTTSTETAGNGINIDGGSLTVNGGNVTAAGGTTGLMILGSATVNGGKLDARGGTGNGIYVTTVTAVPGDLTVNGGTVIARSSGSNAVLLYSGCTRTLPSAYYWRTAADGKYKTQKVPHATSDLEGKYFEVTTTAPADNMLDRVGYLDWDSTNKRLNTKLSYREGATKVTSSTTTLGAENTTTWYYVDGPVTISGKLTAYGDVHLILKDGAALTVEGGVVVNDTTPTEGDKSKLTIYGQENQTGKLVANGSGTAGVRIDSYSALTINGGIIEATGGNAAEGQPVTESYGIHGTYVVINSGKVTATGGTADGEEYAASGGISVWEMTVNGGEITASGGTAKGENSESYGIQADLTIADGTVVAKSAAGKAVVFPQYATLTPPTSYYWRTADNANYKTQNVPYTTSDLEGKYFELTTTKPASSIEPYVTGAAATVTYGDAVNGSVITATTDVNGTFAWKNVDSYGDASAAPKKLMATFTPGESDYVAVDVEVSVTVNKKPLTVTAKDHSITYGDEAANDGVSYDGFVAGEDESKLSGALDYDYTYSRYDDVGSGYTTTPKGLTSGNYNIKFQSGALTVGPKTIGIDWSNTELTHNGKAQKPTATATGLVNGDQCAITVTGEQTDAGTYTATATGLDNPNYKLPENVTCEFIIAAKPADSAEESADSAEEPADSKGQSTKTEKAPHTGDAGVALYVISAASSMTGLVWLGRKKKR